MEETLWKEGAEQYLEHLSVRRRGLNHRYGWQSWAEGHEGETG